MLIALGILIALAVLALVLIAPGAMPDKTDKTLWTAHYAHRGLHTRDGKIPENSLPAFSAAAKAGYGIELDVNITADGEIVVFHDDDLSRLCGTDISINGSTYAQLRRHSLLGTDQHIPLFKDVLETIGGRVPLIVELKSSNRNRLLCEKTAALLDAYDGPYCIESFHPAIVSWFRKNRPQVVRGQLAQRTRSYRGIPLYQKLLLSLMVTNIAARPHFMAFRHEDTPRARLWLFRLMGGRLAGWTVRDTDDVGRLRAYFDVIIFEFFRP